MTEKGTGVFFFKDPRPEWHCRICAVAQIDLGLGPVCFYTGTSLERFKFFALRGDDIDALLGFTHCDSTKEGFLMVALPNSPAAGSADSLKIADNFLGRDGLPFADLISAERISEVFAKHQNLFGVGAVYSTAVIVWSFLGQALRERTGRTPEVLSTSCLTFAAADQNGLPMRAFVPSEGFLLRTGGARRRQPAIVKVRTNLRVLIAVGGFDLCESRQRLPVGGRCILPKFAAGFLNSLSPVQC